MNSCVNVYVDGVFDLFHEGHINFLKQASALGNLIVGVHSDAFVLSYKRLPVIPEKSRYALVRSLKYVHHTIEGVGTLTERMLDEYSIGLVLHGDDFDEAQVLRHYGAAVARGIFRYLPYTEGISSTMILKEIRERMAGNAPAF